MKIGFEVEGRLRGLKSLFVSALDITTHPEETIRRLCQDNGVVHVLVSAIENGSIVGSSILESLSTDYYITVESESFPDYIPKHINVVLVIHDMGIWSMRPTDQVKFVSPSLEVRSVTVATMVYTAPNEFDNDREITI